MINCENKPVLSIITPCYNGEKFIEDAMVSIINQNNNDIEMIIVNDGSIDDTEIVCKRYESAQIRYYQIENHGAGFARNYGIRQAKGEWISFLDADDLYLYKSIDNVIKKLNKSKSDIICTPRAKTDFALINEPKITFFETIEEIKHHIPKLEFWTCLYKKDYIINNSLFFYEFKLQDIETAFRYLTFSNTTKIEIENGLFFYLQRDNLNSNMHTFISNDLFSIKAKVYYDLYKRTNIEEDKNYLLSVVIQMVSRYYINCIKNGVKNKEQFNEVGYIWREIKKDERYKQAILILPKKYSLCRYLYLFRNCFLLIPVRKNKQSYQSNEISQEPIKARWKDISLKLLNENSAIE